MKGKQLSLQPGFRSSPVLRGKLNVKVIGCLTCRWPVSAGLSEGQCWRVVGMCMAGHQLSTETCC